MEREPCHNSCCRYAKVDLRLDFRLLIRFLIRSWIVKSIVDSIFDSFLDRQIDCRFDFRLSIRFLIRSWIVKSIVDSIFLHLHLFMILIVILWLLHQHVCWSFGSQPVTVVITLLEIAYCYHFVVTMDLGLYDHHMNIHSTANILTQHISLSPFNLSFC